MHFVVQRKLAHHCKAIILQFKRKKGSKGCRILFQESWMKVRNFKSLVALRRMTVMEGVDLLRGKKIECVSGQRGEDPVES